MKRFWLHLAVGGLSGGAAFVIIDQLLQWGPLDPRGAGFANLLVLHDAASMLAGRSSPLFDAEMWCFAGALAGAIVYAVRAVVGRSGSEAARKTL